MFKNVSGQTLTVFAFDATTGLPQTGDAANITAYVDKDFAGLNVLSDTSATEVDSTNAKGYYIFALTQAETNADALLFTAKSTTSNIVVLGVPAIVYTVAPNFSSLSVDSSGRVDVIKINGTSQTARDIGASVLLSPGTSTGQVDLSSGQVKVQSGTGSGQISLSSGKVSLVTADMTTIAADVWDVTLASHLTAGSTGFALNAASSAGDPWATALPGAYSSGTAGFIVGTNLNAQVSAVKAKTDNLPAAPAAVSDIPTATQNADALLKRDMSAVSGEASRSLLNAIRVLRNRVTASTGALTVYKEDGTTSAWTATLTTSPTADLIVAQVP